GVQFSEVHLKEGQALDAAYLKDLAQYAKERGLYIEWGGGQHIPFDSSSWKPRDVFPVNQAAAEQARALGVRVIRSCSGGLMRWGDEAPHTEELLREMEKALRACMPMLHDLDVVLAVEIHFEFTTFELLRLFEACGAQPGGCLGICLDTMNLLTMLEDPVAGTERILPWVVATHIKDGGLMMNEQGFVSFPAEVGQGLVNFPRILHALSTLERNVTLSIEDHGGSFEIPVFDPAFLSRFPDLEVWELGLLFKTAQEGSRRMEEGTLHILDRADWPDQCEERVARDIATMKGMVDELRGKGASRG
ncbi:MAG: sugar phosphate isomerase/epimerase family protein, partial [Planctomycetota bacterium]